MRTLQFKRKPYLFAILVFAFVIATINHIDVAASVRMSSFTAKMNGSQVQLAWQTASELNNIGFNLLRSTSPGGPFTKINPTMVISQCFGCITGFSYSYQDTAVSPNQVYYYKLQTVETTGSKEEFGPVSTAPAQSSSSSSAKTSSISSTASSQASSSTTSSVSSTASSKASSSTMSSVVSSSSSSKATSSSIASSTSTSSSRATSSQTSSVATSSATSSPKIAYAASATSSSVATSRSAVSSAASSSVTSVPPVVAASNPSSSVSSSTPPEIVEDESVSPSNASPLRLLSATILVVGGVFSIGAIGVGLLALFLFVRTILR